MKGAFERGSSASFSSKPPAATFVLGRATPDLRAGVSFSSQMTLLSSRTIKLRCGESIQGVDGLVRRFVGERMTFISTLSAVLSSTLRILIALPLSLALMIYAQSTR